MSVSAGLVDPDDIFMTNWNASILGTPGTPFEGRLYSLLIECGPRYPTVPPVIKFTTQITMSCVGPTGMVDMKRLCPNWKYSNDIEHALNGLRFEMNKGENKRQKQPPEGATYDWRGSSLPKPLAPPFPLPPPPPPLVAHRKFQPRRLLLRRPA
eukprot:CAMPEP_0197425224 /NCGR_PEP_ID=MMETSP1170-20131217/29751_1 /TAXON_ID=54406 /ORGANISM="Sarcinochrysis sp, Strain CCMP770" /LENGTH=153 /DNA_ID=CAMNT_0042952763 /DNA_START=18 /DNA_END=477 /DNA_ORIENTATION=+